MDEEKMARAVAEGNRREKVRTQTRNFIIFIATLIAFLAMWELSQGDQTWIGALAVLAWFAVVIWAVRRYGR